MDVTELSSQLGQIREVLHTFARLLETIEEHMQQQDFTVKQIAPILSGTRADIVAMRATLLRIEQGIGPALDVRGWNGEERRRKAG